MSGAAGARATIMDVARLAGVSRQTVTRAMNGMGEISTDTRARVLAAARELDYRPNLFARGMKTRRSDVVGLVVSDISNPFYPSVARGVFDAAAELGWNVVVYNTDAELPREREALEDLIARGAQGVVGFFYALGEEELADYASRTALVVADRILRVPGLSSVNSDFTGGTTEVVRFLADRGHRAIGMLDSSVGVAVDERRTAFLAALGRLDLDQVDAVVSDEPSIDGGARAVRRLIAKRPDTTAVFAFNDLMAFGAIDELPRLGRPVPQRCAVVGFDDLIFARYLHPPLTTVHTDKYEHGRLLVGTLHDVAAAIAAGDTAARTQRISLPVRLIKRSSA